MSWVVIGLVRGAVAVCWAKAPDANNSVIQVKKAKVKGQRPCAVSRTCGMLHESSSAVFFSGEPMLGLVCALVCCGAEPIPRATRFEFTETHMGSPFQIVLYSDSAAAASQASRAAFQRIAELDACLSDYNPDSELMRL